MAGTRVRISGLPSTCNPMKIQFLFSSECKVSIKSLKIDKDDAEVILASKDDAERFQQSLPKTISFGGSTFTVKLSGNQPVETDHAEENELPRMKQNDVDMREVDKMPNIGRANKRKQSDSTKVEPDNKVYSWGDLDELPLCKMGLLVQCQRNIHCPQIRKYFEDDSNGGLIIQMIKMFDGLLIIFKNEKDASKAWSHRPHRISDIPVRVFVKSIPILFERRLVVQSNDKDIDDQKLKQLLFMASPKGIAPGHIKAYRNSFLAAYSKDIEIQDIKDIIDLFQIGNEGIKIFQLLKTDCIKVENASSKFTDEEYKVLFENEHRSCGGPVTKIQRVEDDVLLIYFASFEDVESIVKAFSTNLLDICGHQLKMKRYFHCFHELHENDFKLSTATAFQSEQVPKKETATSRRPGHSERVNSWDNQHAMDRGVDEVMVPMANGKISYLTGHCKQFLEFCVDKQVMFFSTDDVGITFKGERGAVEEVSNRVKIWITQIAHDIYFVPKFGASTFFNSNEGRKLIEEVSSKYETAIILADLHRPSNKMENSWERPLRPHRPNHHDGQRTSGSGYVGQTYSVVFSSFTVSLHEGDITNEKTDAIVNTVHEDFNLDRGRLSSTIVAKADPDRTGQIQTEIKQGRAEYIRVTGSGRLLSKRILHVVLPKDEQNISTCIGLVLAEAEKRKCTSVAFPSIAAGHVGIAGRTIALKMLDGFANFAKNCSTIKHLKSVRIIIPVPTILAEFKLAFLEHQAKSKVPMSSASALSHSSKQLTTSEQFGDICVSVRCGDITNETNDAIVNSVGATFDLNHGQVSKAILRKGGYEIMQEVHQTRGSSVRVTRAGRLQCKKIIHVVMVSPTEKEIKHSLTEVIRVAEEEKCSSISVPAFGTGNLGMHPRLVSKIFVKVFSEFERQKLQYLRRIDIVIFDRKQLQEFTDGFKDAKPGAMARFKRQISNLTSSFPNLGFGSGDAGSYAGSDSRGKSSSTDPKPTSPERDRDLLPGQVTLHFYSMNGSDVAAAVARVKQEVNSVFSEEFITNGSIKYIMPEEVTSLQDHGEKYGVSVEKSGSSIIIKGLKKDVSEVKREVKDMLEKMLDKKMDQEYQPKSSYFWYCTEVDGSLKPVSGDVNDALEEKYQNNRRFCGKLKVGLEEYYVDFVLRELDKKGLERRELVDEKAGNTHQGRLA